MHTTIIYNGSKFAGQDPDPLEKLIEILKTEPLHPKFERTCVQMVEPGSAFREAYGAGTHFHGNFFRLSHAFSVVTDDPAVEAELIALIRANHASPGYRAARDWWT